MKLRIVGFFVFSLFSLLLAGSCFAQATHSAALTWTPPTTCIDGSACTASGFNVYRVSIACPANGSVPTGATLINATPVTVANYTDTTITAPGSYCYYVTALNSGGESGPSNTSGGSLAQPKPQPPTGVTVVVK